MSRTFTRISAPAIVAAVLLALGVFIFSPVRADSHQTPGDAIVARAVTYEGTYQGHCWPWVREVVREAIGAQMGFGYHDGFIEGGAVEVSLANAIPGDIIQVADPNDNGPGAFYSGLHTAIIKTNNGDGTYDVVDSNWRWDGIVRVRERWDPVAWASGYPRVAVRVYRFGDASSPAPTPTPTEEAPPPENGARAQVNTPGSCLNLRDAPNGGQITCLPHNTRLTVLSEPVDAGAHSWVQVSTPDGLSGWVAVGYLSVTEPAPDPEPEPEQSNPPAGDYRAIVPGLVSNGD